jgi:hypothetical protein
MSTKEYLEKQGKSIYYSFWCLIGIYTISTILHLLVRGIRKLLKK